VIHPLSFCSQLLANAASGLLNCLCGTQRPLFSLCLRLHRIEVRRVVATDISTESRTDHSRLIALGLVVLTAVAFGRVLAIGFVNYDDPEYVTANPHIRASFRAASLLWAFSTTEANNWHPLTWMSLQLDHRLFGLRPWGYHLTSLLLHIGSTLLLFATLGSITGAVWRSALVATLFAVHPLHVESVAWVAERKDVLCGFFWMATMAAYVAYTRAPSIGRYLLVAAALSLALMAKPMAVTLPCVLLLMDFWPLGRAASDKRRSTLFALLPEKIPLFALAAGAAILTWNAQQSGGAIEPSERLPFGVRIENALVSYVCYIGMMLWPSGLAPFYPHPGNALPLWQPIAAGILLTGITALTIALALRAPYLPFGWLWFLGTLVPVIGLVQVGEQSLADRYTYIPLVGLFVMFAWGLGDLGERWPALRRAAIAAAVAAICACTVLTWLQVPYWRNSIALWEHALEATADNPVARINAGRAHLEEGGSASAAEQHLRRAIARRPGYVVAFVNLGMALDRQGKTQEAIGCYQQALDIEPNRPVTRNNLGIALAKVGRLDEAIEQLTEAVRLASDYEEARRNLRGAQEAKRRASP
jgi:hypothetical protein